MFNHLCLCDKVSIKTQRVRAQRTSELLSAWRFGENGTPEGAWRLLALSLSLAPHISSPLAVPKLSFYNKPVSSKGYVSAL